LASACSAEKLTISNQCNQKIFYEVTETSSSVPSTTLAAHSKVAITLPQSGNVRVALENRYDHYL
ncbi:MAG: hypothetical protein M1820_010529, partial [Bogoriella megaspora]